MVTMCFINAKERTDGWVLDKLYFRMGRLFVRHGWIFVCDSPSRYARLMKRELLRGGENED